MDNLKKRGMFTNGNIYVLTNDIVTFDFYLNY